MAYATTTSTTDGLFARVRSAIETLGANLRARRDYTRTYNELSRLSPRELADIGLHRANIDDVARETAYRF